GIAACLMTYSHHACRTECYAMTVHYYRLRDYALQHPEYAPLCALLTERGQEQCNRFPFCPEK
ncbi:antirestriction protein, partial [Escherichia coli]|nr:antirestriction protein [Escherichia coli]